MGRSRKKIDPLPDEFNSLEEAGEFWDTHDSTDYEEYMIPVHFDVDLKWSVEELRFPLELMREVRRIARQQDLSTEALINLWLQEKVAAHKQASEATESTNSTVV